MADDDRPRPTRRSPGAYQPIEPLDESGSGIPRSQVASPAPESPRDEPRRAAAAPTERPAQETAPIVPIAVRFASAAAALAFAGQMLSIGRGEGLTFSSEDERARWVRTRAEIDIARELAAAAHGVTFVEVAPGRLVEDHGWGAPPTADSPTAGTGGPVDPGALAPASLADLIRIAGLQATRERPVAAVHVLLPGALLAGIVSRALDMRLDVAHRPVRLRSLFTGPGEQATMSALIELRLSAPEGHLPAALLSSLAREAQLTICRPAGDSGNLLVQYGMGVPLHDDLLAGLIGDQAWVLSNGRLGCHVMEAAGTFTDSVSCVRLADSYALRSFTPLPDDDQPVLPELRIARERTYGRSVDAILLTGADLDAVALLLEGHPLAESAQLIRGRDQHLLVAPGGVLEQLPVGDSLYCIGPGPLYLPLGYGIRPRLPSTARRALFTMNAQTAVVLLPTVMLEFDVDHKDPVWTLWAGPLPVIDLQLPEGALASLEKAAMPSAAAAAGQPARDERAPVINAIRTWLDEALDAEFRGELARAAELHERHGDPVRAAHLYARAAEEAG